MAKTREFKNINGVTLFPDKNKCYINRKGKSLMLNNCNILELRNIDLQYARDMPSSSLFNFKKPVTCYHNSADKFLFCGVYKK